MTQVVTGNREFDVEPYMRGNGHNTGREYMTVPCDNSSIDAPSVRPSAKNQETQKSRRASTNRSTGRARKSSREPRSASRDRSRDRSAGYTLKELEKRERSLQKKLAAKREEVDDRQNRKAARVSNSGRNPRNNLVGKAAPASKERSLSTKTFQKMNMIGQNTILG